jgi:AcrR family transcriptional regulator
VSARGSALRSGEAPSTRDLILDAAEGRFAERGFAAVSMREIAAEAGLKNQASLYHHFRDKRALYEAVLARGVTALVAVLGESTRSWPTDETGRVEAVGKGLERMLDYLDEHPHLPRLIQRAGIDDSRSLRSAVTRLLRPFYTQGLRVLEGNVGAWEPADLPHLAAGLYHLIFGYYADATLLEVVLQQDPHSPAAAARQRRFLKTAVAELLGVTGLRRPTRRRGGG